MFEGKAYDWIKRNFGEYLYGFDKDQFYLSLFSGIINIKNANLRPDKINDLLAEYVDFPFCVQAGMILNLNCEVQKFKLIHEFTTKKIFNFFWGKSQERDLKDKTSISIQADEILIILGPNMKHVNIHENMKGNFPAGLTCDAEEFQKEVCKRIKQKDIDDH